MTDQASPRVGKFLLDLFLIELFLCPSAEIQNDFIDAGKKLLKTHGIDLKQCSIIRLDSFKTMGKEVKIGYFSVGVANLGEEGQPPSIEESAYRVIIDQHEKIRIEYLGAYGKVISEIVHTTHSPDGQLLRVSELRKTIIPNT